MILERLIVVFLLIVFIPIESEAAPLQMKLHFIEVGQGDSILIETPMRKTILIDGGPPEAGRTVTSYLKKQNIGSIDLLISTHPHIDHIGGLSDVIKAFNVNHIIDSGQTYSTRTYRNYIKLIKQKEIPVTVVSRDDEINIDPFLHINVLNSHEKGKTANESAIALQLTFNEKSFLLMSDVEKKEEREIMEQYNLKSDMIKIGHHGSKTSSSMSFLQKVRPDIALLTYDIDNDFGHPATAVINNLHHLDVDIYSTATFGHMKVVTNGYDYVLFPERSPVQNIK